jgi:DNA helicase-2/ATP-dependent DNA helicase PcrA
MANDKNGVQLSTIHRSKGLEFPVVFVIGLVEGILPSKRGDMEEEVRRAA